MQAWWAEETYKNIKHLTGRVCVYRANLWAVQLVQFHYINIFYIIIV